jgi:hypothetical protein
MSQFEFVLTSVSFLIAIMLGRVISTVSTMTIKMMDFRHVGWLVIQ